MRILEALNSTEDGTNYVWQLDAPSRSFAVLISSWCPEGNMVACTIVWAQRWLSGGYFTKDYYKCACIQCIYSAHLRICAISRLRCAFSESWDCVPISRLYNYCAQSSDCATAHYIWHRRWLANCSTKDVRQDNGVRDGLCMSIWVI